MIQFLHLQYAFLHKLDLKPCHQERPNAVEDGTQLTKVPNADIPRSVINGIGFSSNAVQKIQKQRVTSNFWVRDETHLIAKYDKYCSNRRYGSSNAIVVGDRCVSSPTVFPVTFTKNRGQHWHIYSFTKLQKATRLKTIKTGTYDFHLCLLGLI